MSKQLIDPKDKAGFMNLSSDGKHTQVIAAYAMSGKDLENYLERFGAQFPITVGSHQVVCDKDECYYYRDINGVKKEIPNKKGSVYKGKQKEQGTLHEKNVRTQANLTDRGE